MKKKITILALSCLSLSYAQFPPNSPLNNPAVKKKLFTHATTTGANIMLANYFTTFIEMRTISDRTNTIRNNVVDPGFYARIYGGKLEPRSLKQFTNFSQDYYSGQLGYDTTIYQSDNTQVVLGAELGYLYSDNHYKYAKGNSKSFNASLYASLFTKDHYYVEGFLKYSHIRNYYEFNHPLARQILKNNSKSNNNIMLSLETGKRWYFNQQHRGWYIEPQLQLTYSTVKKTHFQGPYNLELISQPIKLPLLRTGLLAGYNFDYGDGFYNFYAKLNYIRNFKSEINFKFRDITHTNSIKKHWCDYSIGSHMTFNRHHSAVLEVGTANGNCFKEDLNLSFAYRYNF